MRAAINAGVNVAKGEYLLKCDAHVIFQEGFDEILSADCDEDWVVTPVRYSLDADKWERKSAREKPPVYYEYLSYPYQDGKWTGLHAQYWWKERDRARKEFDIDENFCFQGSSWFVNTKHYRELVHPMDDVNYGMFIGEPQEIGLKYWLSGGKNMLNKKVWVSHLWKGQGYRDLHMKKMGFPYTRVSNSELKKGNEYSIDFWFNNRWDKRIHDLSWLVERFWPVPSWPDEKALWSNLKVGDYVRPGK
jgi:glycosyltransferase involved in cell wall biosynthesis